MLHHLLQYYSRILYKDEQSMKYLENWIYPGFWDQIINLPFECTPTLRKPHACGHLPYSNIKIGKSNTPTIFKIMRECSSLHRILVCCYQNYMHSFFQRLLNLNLNAMDQNQITGQKTQGIHFLIVNLCRVG